MKTLARNKKPIYYAVYQGKTKAVDANGLFTGESINSYAPVVGAKMKVSANMGNANIEQFGITDPFTVRILTDDLSCPINTASILWVGFGSLSEYDSSAEYEDGAIVVKDGTIQKLNGEEWVNVPHTHEVLRVAQSLNHITYLVKEVEVSA